MLTACGPVASGRGDGASRSDDRSAPPISRGCGVSVACSRGAAAGPRRSVGPLPDRRGAPVSRRLPTRLTATLVLGLSAAPALAGEDGDGDGTADLHAPSHGCTSGHRIAAVVSGDNIDHVAFFVNGDLVRTERVAGSEGNFRFSMGCS